MLDAKKQTGLHPRPYLRNVNVQWGRLDLSDLRVMDVSSEESDRFSVRTGDLLLCEGGEPGRCAIVPTAADGLAYQKALHRIRPKAGFDVRFLAYALEYMTVSGHTGSSFTGSTIRHLPLEKLVALRIPHPPNYVQRLIADALDEQLSRLDEARRCATRVRALLEALRLSVLRDFFAKEGETTVEIGDIATVSSGATPSRNDARYWSGGSTPWLTSGDLNSRHLHRAEQFITAVAVSETSVRLFKPDTILMAMYGEGQTRGRCARLMFESTSNQACAGITLNEDAPVSPAFLQAFLEASYLRNRKLSAGGVQPNLNLGIIRKIQVPVPGPETQAQLVNRYEAALTVILTGTAALGRMEGQSGMLRQACLRDALLGVAAGEASAGTAMPGTVPDMKKPASPVTRATA